MEVINGLTREVEAVMDMVRRHPETVVAVNYRAEFSGTRVEVTLLIPDEVLYINRGRNVPAEDVKEPVRKVA